MNKKIIRQFASITTRNNKITYANAYALELLGCKMEDILQLPLQKIFISSKGGFSVKLNNKKKHTYSRAFSLKSNNGSLKKVVIFSHIIPGHNFDILHTFSLSSMANMSFERTISYFSSISLMYLTNPTIMFILDSQTLKIEFANLAAQSFYYSKNGLVGMKYTDLDKNLSPIIISDIVKAGSDGRIIHVSSVHCVDQTMTDVLMDISGIYLGKECLLIFVHNTSRHKQLEKLLEEKNLAIEQINKNIYERVNSEVTERRLKEQFYIQQSRLYHMSEMIRAVAHRWRQPLNILGLLVQDLEDAHDYQELSKEYIEKFVEKAMFRVKEMSQIIDNFLYFFRTASKKESFNTVVAVRDSIEFLKPQLSENNINIVLNFEGNEDSDDFLVEGYPNEFKQVFVNILRNSEQAFITKLLKSTEHLSGVIETMIYVNDNYVTIDVVDNGGGVDIDLLPNIFDPYFTTDPTGKSTGLGLYMAKAIIEENMNGEVFAENFKEGLKITIMLYKEAKYEL